MRTTNRMAIIFIIALLIIVLPNGKDNSSAKTNDVKLIWTSSGGISSYFHVKQRESDFIVVDIYIRNLHETWYQVRRVYPWELGKTTTNVTIDIDFFYIGPYQERIFRDITFYNNQSLYIEAQKLPLSKSLDQMGVAAMHALEFIARGLFGKKIPTSTIEGGSAVLETVPEELFEAWEYAGVFAEGSSAAYDLGYSLANNDIQGAIEAAVDLARGTKAVKKVVLESLQKLGVGGATIGTQAILGRFIDVLLFWKHIMLLTEYAYGTFSSPTTGFATFEAELHEPESQDINPPRGGIDFPIANTTIGNNITVQSWADDDNSGVAKVDFKISTNNGVSWQIMGSDESLPFEYTFDLSGFVDGTISFAIDIYDNVGNKWTSGTCEVNKDTSPLPVGIDNALFIKDVTIPDYALVTPRQSFIKTWRLKNSGSTTWTDTYHLSFVSGHRLGAPNKVDVETVPSNSNAEISINMIAPVEPGTYLGYWQMENASGVKFGNVIWIVIIVQGQETYTTSLYRQNPFDWITMSQGELREVEVDFSNGGSNTIWENVGGMVNPDYIELRSCDVNGIETECLFWDQESWIDRRRVGSYLYLQGDVSPSQVARFVFKIYVNPNLIPGDYSIYFRPYHVTGGWIENWNNMHFRIHVLGSDIPSLTTKRIWNFSGDLEGWTLANDIEVYSFDPNGFLVINPGPTDPIIKSSLLSLKPVDFNYLKILGANYGDNQNGQLFIRSDSEDYNAVNQYVFSFPNDRHWHDIVIPLKKIPGWSTTHWITGLRIDPVFTGIPVNGSDNVFIDYIELGNDKGAPSIFIGVPDGGENLTSGSSFRIRWNASDDIGIDYIDIYLSENGGSDYFPIKSGLPNIGYYDWDISNNQFLGKIKVIAYDLAGNTSVDESDGIFNVVSSDLSPTAPHLNDINNLTGSYTVLWNSVEGAQSYLLQEDDNNSFSSPQEYATNDLDYFVSNKPNGTYYYQVCGVNQYGRGEWSNTESATVTVDHFPNKPQVVSPADDSSYLPLSVTLQWSCTHPDGKPLTYNVNFTSTNTENYYTNNEVSINQTETSYTVSNLPYNTTCSWAIKAIDPDGDCMYSDMFHFTTIGDNTVPTGSITINNGAATTQSYAVELNLSASDTETGVSHMRLSNDGAHWTYWYGFNETYSWNLANSNYGGLYDRTDYTVYIQYKDWEGNISQLYSDSITKLQGSPGQIILNGEIYVTLFDAMQVAIAGDTIFMTPGYYDLNGREWPPRYPTRYVGVVMKDDVTLMGAGANKTFLDFDGSFWTVIDGNNSVIQGFTIINSIVGYQSTSYKAESSNSELKDCILHSSYNITVESGAQNILIQNCIIENGDYGIRLGNQQVKLYNNIFKNFSATAIFGTEPLEIKNNIIINNGTGIRLGNANSSNIRNNNVWNNSHNYSLDNLPGTDLTGVNGNISQDPKLNSDYSLQASSPCINAGTNVGISYYGSAPDIGAKEYGASGALQVNSNHIDCSFTISGPQDYSGSGVNWTASNVPIGIYYASFSGIEGHYTPKYQTVDLKHGETEIFNGNYQQDIVGPAGKISINHYEYATSDPIVSIMLDFEDDVAGIGNSSQMKFSNDGSEWSLPESYSTYIKNWSLLDFGGNPNEETKTVYAKVSDELGNWSESITDQILYKPSRNIITVPEQYSSIQEAIDVAQDGDIVWVGPGSFSEAITLKEGIELRGSGEGLTNLGNQLIKMANNSLISGFAGFYQVDGNQGFFIIENNYCNGWRFCNSYGNGVGLIRNNLLNWVSQTSYGIYLGNQAKGIIENNTINHTGSGMNFGLNSNFFEPSFLINNIFSNNKTAIYDQNSDREHQIIISSYNTFWQNDENCGGWSTGNELLGEGDVEQDPRYVNPSQNDFTLQSVSPSINSGDPRDRFYDVDGSRNDRGYTGGPCFNTSPIADFSFDPLIGSVGTDITFDANLSSDQQSDIEHLWIRWDWENDGVWDTPFSLEKTIIHQFGTAGNKTVGLQIRDEDFFIGSTTKQITIGNEPPNIPSNPVPNDNATNVPTSVTIQWDGGDPNGNGSVLYDVYFGTLASPPLAVADFATTSIEIDTLIYNQFYFWKVVSKDNEGATTIGPIWHFSTTGEPLPIIPTELTIQEPNSAEIQINWTDVSENEIGFKIGRKLEEQTDFTQIAVVQSDQTSYTDQYGLLGDSTYVYAVKAYNSSGNTDYSNNGQVIAPRVSYYDFPVSDGAWYMVSLLLHPFNNNISELFPTALGSNAFVWNDGSYSQTTTVDPQNGFWLPIPDSWFGDIAGYGVYEYSIHFGQPGWFMIGGVVEPVDFTDPNDSPDGSIITPAYSYDPYSKNYYATNTIDPKQGFWVAVLQVCDLNIGGEPLQQTMQKTFPKKMSKEAFFANYGEVPPLPPKINWETGEIIEMPKEFCLYQNYPNPFNPSTTISFDIPKESRVKIVIFNLMGQQVSELTNQNYSAGNHNLIWDGKNDYGQLVSSGIYLVRMISGDFTNLKKLILVH